jgi:hypothetical protein
LHLLPCKGRHLSPCCGGRCLAVSLSRGRYSLFRPYPEGGRRAAGSSPCPLPEALARVLRRGAIVLNFPSYPRARGDGLLLLFDLVSSRLGSPSFVFAFLGRVLGRGPACLTQIRTYALHAQNSTTHHCPPVPRSQSACEKLLNGRPFALQLAITER